MSSKNLVPVAEYVRMSTEEQPNSILLQQQAIRRYAAAHGYEVVETYADPGRSGVEIKHRPGLRALIQKVVGGEKLYRAILVADVSRWGRFQDIDESAHYEFLCRSAGTAIHYCEEPFENTGTLSNDIMKSLKRTMAAEYSRQLSVKAKAGMTWLASQGFRVGSSPGYGLRRMLISRDGKRKQALKPYERKSLTSDRVILIPGPEREVNVVRTIFTLASQGQKSAGRIAQELNRRNIKYVDGKCWTKSSIFRILKNEKYIGTNVWGRTTKPFSQFTRRLPRNLWTIKTDAFTPLVSTQEFHKVQELIERRRPRGRSDEYYLGELRRILALEGKLTHKILRKCCVFDHQAFARRFGSTLRAYELIGYTPSPHALASKEGWRKIQQLKSRLLGEVENLFSSNVQIVKLPPQRLRKIIQIDKRIQVAVYICRPLPPSAAGPRWMLVGNSMEANLMSLICFPSDNLDRCTDFYLVPEIASVVSHNKVMYREHPLLRAGKRLESLSQLYDAARQLLMEWKPQNCIVTVGEVVLDERASLLRIASRKFRLSRQNAKIVKILLENAGRAVPTKAVCNYASGSSEWFVRNHVMKLRKKLGTKFRNRLKTVDGGYMYVPPVSSDIPKLSGT